MLNLVAGLWGNSKSRSGINSFFLSVAKSMKLLVCPSTPLHGDISLSELRRVVLSSRREKRWEREEGGLIKTDDNEVVKGLRRNECRKVHSGVDCSLV